MARQRLADSLPMSRYHAILVFRLPLPSNPSKRQPENGFDKRRAWFCHAPLIPTKRCVSKFTPYSFSGCLTHKGSLKISEASFSETKNTFRQRTACQQAVENAHHLFRLPQPSLIINPIHQQRCQRLSFNIAKILLRVHALEHV